MSILENPIFLRRVLIADALASGAMGALLAAAAAPLSGLLGLPAGLLLGAGLVLLPWAAVVGWLGLRQAPPSRGAVRAVVVLNALWVVDSLLLPLTGWVAPTPLGLAVLVGQALAVAGLAALQALALRGGATQPAAA